MDLKIKALLSGLSTHIPGYDHEGSTGGTDSARYCYSVWLRHLVLGTRSAAVKSIPRVVAELGPGDSIGIGYGYAQIGNSARQLDPDTGTIMPGYPVRSREAVLEVTYQIQVTEWWQLQPDFQYITAPGGGIPNPSAPGQKIGDAAVLGVRSTIAF